MVRQIHFHLFDLAFYKIVGTLFNFRKRTFIVRTLNFLCKVLMLSHWLEHNTIKILMGLSNKNEY